MAEYRIEIEISGHKEGRCSAIETALQYFPFKGWYTGMTDCFMAWGEGRIAGDLEEAMKVFAGDVCKANDGPCKVVLHSTRIVDLPFETFVYDNK